MIGSVGITNPSLFKQWLKRFGPSRIVLAVDVKIINQSAMVAINGWQNTTDTTMNTLIQKYLASGLTHILCTDIERDGALTGPNIRLYQAIQQQYPNLALQASGGIRNNQDIERLQKIGISGCIVGRAIYEKKVSLC